MTASSLRSARRRAAWLPVLAIVGLALAARLAVIAVLDPLRWIDGSDTRYYVNAGWRLVHDSHAPPPAVAPLYAHGLAVAWVPWLGVPMPGSAAGIPLGLLTVVRVTQALLGVAMVCALASLAWHLAGVRRAAVATALGLGLGPAFVLEPFRVLTETLALALLALALVAWVAPGRGLRRALLTGALLGLASLTRPVMFGLPWLLALHERWRARPHAGLPRKAQDRWARRWHGLVMVTACLVVVAPWPLALHESSGRWWPEGLASNLWIGSVGEGAWVGPGEADRLRDRFAGGPDDYLGEVARTVRERPLEWTARRLRNLGAALARPHFASDIGGPPFFAAIEGWRTGETGTSTLIAALRHPSSVTKLVLYACHWIALVAGGAGLWRARRNVPGVGALAAVVLYFIVVHAFLMALPRYLLPIQLPLWVGVGLYASRRACRDDVQGAAS